MVLTYIYLLILSGSLHLVEYFKQVF